MNEQEKVMSILAQGYQILSKAMKLQPSKEGFLQVLLMLGEDGIQACIKAAEQGPEVVALTMAQVIQEKQTLKAEYGAKLNRLMALNNHCPEGYMKKGGKCKKCEKGEKIDPSKGAFHISSYFRNGTNKGGISNKNKKSKSSNSIDKTKPYHTRVTSVYKKSPGYKKLTDTVVLPTGTTYERNIDITPMGNDTTYKAWPSVIDGKFVGSWNPLTGSDFETIMNNAPQKRMIVAPIVSIPFYKQ